LPVSSSINHKAKTGKEAHPIPLNFSKKSAVACVVAVTWIKDIPKLHSAKHKNRAAATRFSSARGFLYKIARIIKRYVKNENKWKKLKTGKKVIATP
jgi:hypothetical protein